MKMLAASIWVLLLMGIAAAQTSLAPDPGAQAVESGKTMLAIPAGTHVVRFLPPLNITRAEVDEAVAKFRGAL